MVGLQYEGLTEWTFEGGLNLTVGVDGNRTRYQYGMYDAYMKEWTFVNLSGTAIIDFITVSGFLLEAVFMFH